MVKKKMPFSIEPWVLELAKSLGINRSKVAQDALIAAISIELDTIDVSRDNLQEIVKARTNAKERIKESSRTRLQQETDWQKEQEALHQSVRTLYSTFCKKNHIDGREFKESLMGEGQYTEREQVLEAILVGELRNAGLPADLNIVRETVALA